MIRCINIVAFLVFWSSCSFAAEVRIKDISSIKGNRTNQLTGLGLVVGLPGTGDSPKSISTNKMVANLITRLGIDIQPTGVISKSVAAVVVTATLPAFARNGSKVDVKVSVIGDALSLVGGTLIQTRLTAGDGLVYVVGSGQIVTGQANGVGPKTLTVANIPDGGVVEREFTPDLMSQNGLALTLKDPDFTTSSRIAEAINKHFKGFYAESIDSTEIEIQLPPMFVDRPIDYIAEIEGIKVDKDIEAMVVINEHTGTVVMGADVTIEPVVISHGDLTIQVGKPKNEKIQTVAPINGATVGDLVKSLNALGVAPPDLVGIVQGIHAAGALNAKLKMM